MTTACPECGSFEYVNENLLGEGYRECKRCHQDWWTDIDYEAEPHTHTHIHTPIGPSGSVGIRRYERDEALWSTL